MKKHTVFKYGFIVPLACIAAFTLPMSEICACESSRAKLEMAFSPGHDATEAQLARTIRTQMEDFNVKLGYPEWDAAGRKQIVKKAEGFDNPQKIPAHPVSMLSWIGWFAPERPVPPGDCSPRPPWKDGQAISCKFYQERNIFKETGWQLDFRITSKGVIRDVQFYRLSSLFGRETTEIIP